ncbi:MAG: 23S rRNA (uracil(1939)-C(5))-methyltransferase RlmD [Desulfatitalea sp.]|nr:23S rRNA (uracil(1939)-C(5))-methyltransferase RlmD [Desulfatitalea sp.]NNK00984.1 23S rRNA (uracil(1939)-C(5))-methyltransferase RlmD [Desulfatitalea sp.]
MALKKGQLVELEIDGIAFGGRGFCRVDGMATFIDGAVPHDRVLARITKKRKSHAEGKAIEILSPSPLRVTPRCRYSGICGGCKWQYLNYDDQLRFKQQHVIEALTHIALLEAVPVHPTLPSEKVFGYRNKMEFSCAKQRWLMPEELGDADVEKGMALGLHVPGTFHKVLDIEQCMLQPDMGNMILRDVRRFIKASPMPVYGLRSHEGFWRFLVLRHSVAEDQWMVNLVTSGEQPEQVHALSDSLRSGYPNIVSVINTIHTGKAGVAIGEYDMLLSGVPSLWERIGPFAFEISANSFFQTNTRGAERLYDTVAAYSGLSGTEQVLDLYCGTGTISIYLAGQAKKVVGMEMVESAVADARRNSFHNGINNCSFISGDIRRILPQLDMHPDVMIIDPPRAGMHADVVQQILATSPERIVYVSCNPATLARDLGLMKDAYDVMEVQPVDMFPHTYHIEAVARLLKS